MRPSPLSIVLVVLAALAVAGLAAGSFMAPERASVASMSLRNAPAAPTTEASIEKLRHELELARLERDRFADDLAALRQSLDELRLELADAKAALQGQAEQRSANAEPGMLDGSRVEPPQSAPSPSLEARLASAGFDTRSVDSIRALIEQSRLDELYLQHQAQREGWSRSDLVAARQVQRAQIRTELGDRSYDYMLWAAGEPNRVQVRDVLPGSAAAALEIQPNDVILRYAGDRVFALDDLRTLTAQGTLGESVLVEILRDGRKLTLEAPRGPLGVQIQPLQTEPEPSDR